MTIDPSSPAVTIGRLLPKANRKGHAELSNLHTRTQDRRATIHDPQERTATEGEREDFMNHANNDECVVYDTVYLEKMIQIINYLIFSYFKLKHNLLNSCSGMFKCKIGEK